MADPTITLHSEMTDRWLAAGKPSFREIARATGVPVSNAHAAVRGPALVRLEQFTKIAAFLASASNTDLASLLQLWHGAEHFRTQRSLPARRGERCAYLVLNATGEMYAFIPDNAAQARSLAHHLGGLVAELPLIADYSARVEQPAEAVSTGDSGR